MLLLAAATLAALLGLLVTIGRTGRRGALALVLVALLWIPLNHPLEGPVLHRFSDDHGFTAADILTLVGGGVAALRLWQLHRRGRRGHP